MSPGFDKMAFSVKILVISKKCNGVSADRHVMGRLFPAAALAGFQSYGWRAARSPDLQLHAVLVAGRRVTASITVDTITIRGVSRAERKEPDKDNESHDYGDSALNGSGR
jgi:hypothetical protein